jgi:anaerobic selenocysteine-containing dehydrogenase
VSNATALDTLAERLRDAGSASAFLATPQATNEDLFAFRMLAEKAGGMLDFRVGDPQDKVRKRSDHILLRDDRNPNTQGCLDQGLGKAGVQAILDACAKGQTKALVLQGPELLRVPEAGDALAKVPFIGVMATHEGPELDRAHCVLPAAMWPEVDGTFTNYQRRIQRIKASVPAPGDARARWELAAGLLQRLGQPIPATSAREIFALVARAVPDYAGLDYRAIGPEGKALPLKDETAAAEARA